ncbi:MAG: sulfatase-like hydrolase/transferase, partial [Spirochaetales bacterium]|nr:sulfatase-like hydrolase/transferase [Spirochaetales bacterium]
MQNILLIMSDQQRTDTLGFTGKTVCETPNIDALAAHGVSFDNAVTPCPLCGPARVSIFTGLYPHQASGVLLEDGLGVRGKDGAGLETDMMINDSSLRETPHLTNLLKDAGYYTGYAGKWHLGNDIIGNWFEDYFGEDNQQYLDWLAENNLPDAWPLSDMEVRSTRVPHMSIPRTKVNDAPPEQMNDAWIADHCIRRIENRPKEKPFFICCGFNGPHPPFKIPEPYFSMYNPDDVPEPLNFLPEKDKPASKENSFYRQLWRDNGDSWASWRKSVAVYWGFCSFIDHQVGRLVECLKQEQAYEDTLVIYCSDHGEMLGQHGLWHKMQAYEESLRVPMIFSQPTWNYAVRSSALVSLLDIPSTILSAAGLDIPESYQGIDLCRGIFDEDWVPDRNYLYSEQKPLGAFHGEVDWRMITDNRWKYIWNNGDINELFDLSVDP